MNKNNIVFLIIFTSLLFSENQLDIGCASEVSTGIQECSIENILTEKKSSILIREEQENTFIKPMKISETITSLKVFHQKQPLVIERILEGEEKSCPPFCIQPMSIEGVTTVGELEVLSYIKNLNIKKSQLLIDVRERKLYKKSTIPGALNLPYTMLKRENKYFMNVLELLGGKKHLGKWTFSQGRNLLIFSDGEENYSVNIIKMLINVGYDRHKLFYYRGGIESWKHAGLTLY